MEQYQHKQRLEVLNQEYQALTDKVLSRTITCAEEKRIDAICAEMNKLQRKSDLAKIYEQREKKADELIAKSAALLAQLRQEFAG